MHAEKTKVVVETLNNEVSEWVDGWWVCVADKTTKKKHKRRQTTTNRERKNESDSNERAV